MTNQQLLRDVTYKDFFEEYQSSESTNNEIKKEEYYIFDKFSTICIGYRGLNGIYHLNFSSLIDVDLSSVFPHLEINNETYQKEPVKEEIIEDISEYNLVFRIPPQKIYKIRMNVKSIKKGVIRIIEP